jgi:hypothetical protein
MDADQRSLEKPDQCSVALGFKKSGYFPMAFHVLVFSTVAVRKKVDMESLLTDCRSQSVGL